MDRRLFLAGALALAPTARAAAPLDAQATRLGPSSVRLAWTGAGAVSILASDDPEAPRSAMRPLKTLAGAMTQVTTPISPRPYFLVRAADGRQTRVAERLLPLTGGRNFRDLGGWRSVDGRQVKWGRIYRSGVMTDLTMADITYLQDLGVTVICDLRNPQERATEPSPFLKAGGPRVAAFDYETVSLAPFVAMTTREQAIQGFADAYVALLDHLAPNFTDLFARLADDAGPLAMNCSAGKDRTGLASALVLSTLGVSRATVIADYALSQTYVPPTHYASQFPAFAKTPSAVTKVILGSDPEVMRRALAVIDTRWGGPSALAKTRYGLTDAMRQELRRLYLS
uniref:tyrosine-protein phosphatase n=1 Tax=uncultured Caulobacter sp. TaxID=158749 RepID=UPI0025D68857|nr:tyrosine-protein phosphatase [uncultured Caulobacter sp.]